MSPVPPMTAMFMIPVSLPFVIDHPTPVPGRRRATASSTDAATSSGADTLSACETPAQLTGSARSGPLGGEALQLGGDVQVRVAVHEPRRELRPRRGIRRQALGERGLGDRSLGRGHEGGRLGGHVGAELIVEGVGADGELVAAGRDPVGGQRPPRVLPGNFDDSDRALSPVSGAKAPT